MATISLEFANRDGRPELLRTIFAHPSLAEPLHAERGTDFDAKSGVVALAVFLLHSAAGRDLPVGERTPLAGVRPSPAVSLLDAMAQAERKDAHKNKWLRSIFGGVRLSTLVEKTGADAKTMRAKGVSLALKTAAAATTSDPRLSPRSIAVRLDDRALETPDELADLRSRVENEWRRQSDEARAKVRPKSATRQAAKIRPCRPLDARQAHRARRLVTQVDQLYLDHDDRDEALRLVEEVQTESVSHGDEQVDADARMQHAHLDFENGQFEGARRKALTALDRHSRRGEPARMAAVLNTLAVFDDAAGRWEDARERYRESERLFLGADPATPTRGASKAKGKRSEEPGYVFEACCVAINRSVAEFFLSGASTARRVGGQALATLDAIGQSSGPTREQAYGSLDMAIYSLAQGKPADATPWLTRGRDWIARTGEEWYQFNLSQMLAVWHRLRGETNEALALLDVPPDEGMRDRWAVIDGRINLALGLIDPAGRPGNAERSRAMGLLREAMRESEPAGYVLGTGLAAFALARDFEDQAAAPLAHEFQRRLAGRFKKLLFMPTYALNLRAILPPPPIHTKPVEGSGRARRRRRSS